MITVDEIKEYPKITGPAARYGIKWCHLTTDDTSVAGIAALHDFARKIGCSPSWFQGPKKYKRRDLWHYDLVPSFRDRAIAAGAVEVSALEQARSRAAKMVEAQGG
jgi:hypothetical protein